MKKYQMSSRTTVVVCCIIRKREHKEEHFSFPHVQWKVLSLDMRFDPVQEDEKKQEEGNFPLEFLATKYKEEGGYSPACLFLSVVFSFTNFLCNSFNSVFGSGQISKWSLPPSLCEWHDMAREKTHSLCLHVRYDKESRILFVFKRLKHKREN